MKVDLLHSIPSMALPGKGSRKFGGPEEEFIDTRGEGKQSMLTSLTILGYTSFKAVKIHMAELWSLHLYFNFHHRSTILPIAISLSIGIKPKQKRL